MTTYETYRLLFPTLPREAILFFASENCKKEPTLVLNKVHDFCNHFAKKYDCPMPQPQVVDILCQRLSSFGWMSPGRTGTFNAHENEYIVFIKDFYEIQNNRSVDAAIRCAAYGFPEVYDLYKNSVIPLVFIDANGDKQIGSSFVLGPSTVATAWHCLENASALSLRGVSAGTDFKICRHSQQGVDLATLEFVGSPFASLLNFSMSEASVLDDVIVMGYPNLPGYVPNIAGEKALISSKLTALDGQVASQTFEIWSKENVFLITSRVRGGFSGGPVLDRLGQCVGVVARDPIHDDAASIGQQYDNLGYGVAMPAKSLLNMLNDPAMSTLIGKENLPEITEFE